MLYVYLCLISYLFALIIYLRFITLFSILCHLRKKLPKDQFTNVVEKVRHGKSDPRI